MADLLSLDWAEQDLPDDFEPIDAIVLVKGVYHTEDGDLTRPVWSHRWTMALARNGSERIGALRVAARMTENEVMSEYTDEDDDDAS